MIDIFDYRQRVDLFVENIQNLVGRPVFDVVVNGEADNLNCVFEVRLRYSGVIHVNG